jgi:gamma-tubulin complex component 3
MQEVDDSKDLSLKKLYLWTLEPLERLKWIAVLTESFRKLTGGKILSSLYAYSSHGSPQLQDLVDRILKKTLGPFMNFLKMWVLSFFFKLPLMDFRFIPESLWTQWANFL